MTTPDQVKRCDWSARDVEKWNARIQDILGKRLGSTEVPPPIDWDAVNREADEEWLAAKADVLLSRLPERHRDAQPRHPLSVRWLNAYSEGRMINLAITGPARVGKTWEMAAIARSLLMTHGTPVAMIEVPTLMDKLRPHPDTSADADMGYFQSVPVLALDDLGAEKTSEWTTEQLYRLANHRSNHNLPTIVTSNLGPDGLDARYGERICGRLFEGAALLEIHEKPDTVPTRFGADL